MSFEGNKSWCTGGLKPKKKLSKHDAEIFNIVSRINATDRYHSLYNPTGAEAYSGQDLRNFLWDGIACKIRTKHWRNVMPKSFAAIAELAVQGGISVSNFLDFKLPQLEIDNGVKIKNDEYLILWKRNKKVYYKPEVLQEVSEIVNNSLSGSKVKYVIFSKKNYARYVNSEDNVVEENFDIKLYQKEKDALEKGGLEFVQDINVEMLYKCSWMNTNCVDTVFRADGWLFKIKEDISLCDAEKTFRKIREKRLKELGIDF